MGGARWHPELPPSPVAHATPGPCIPWGSLSLGEGQPKMPGALRRCWGEVPYHIDDCSGILVSGSASEGAQPETPLSPQWPELVLAPCICDVVYSSTVPEAFLALSPSPERVSATCSQLQGNGLDFKRPQGGSSPPPTPPSFVPASDLPECAQDAWAQQQGVLS